MAVGQATDIRVGGRIYWPAMKVGGYMGTLDGNLGHVVLDNGNEQTFNLNSGAIVADPFKVGEHVMRPDGTVGVVWAEVPAPEYPTWEVSWANGTTTHAVEMTLQRAVLQDPIGRFKAGRLSRASEFNLRSVAADLWTRHLHDELVSLAHARVDLKPHQVSVVHRVVSGYPYRFLLCDEVGLGKTIEAAMIVKELRARGLAKRVLVLVPSGLAGQWQSELKTKFNETFAIFNKATIDYLKNKGDANPWLDTDSVIASHAWASWTPARRAEIAAVPWDMIIVDEAHHARRQRHGNRVQETNLYRLVRDLTARSDFARRSALFVTATPLQLQRHELFALVEMLNPVLFASERDFESHVDALAGLSQLVEGLEKTGAPSGPELEDFLGEAAYFLETEVDQVRAALEEPRTLANRLRARHRLSEVLLRNRRAVIGGFMPRKAYRWEVERSPDEVAVQDKMDAIIEEGYELAEESRRNAVGFLMVIWQKLAASSSRALLCSLEKRRERLLSDGDGPDFSVEDAEDDLGEDTPVAEIAGRPAAAVSDEVRRLDEVIELLKRISLDSKARTLIDRLRDLFNDNEDEKVLIFTEFRETQDMLAGLISAEEWDCQIFHGKLDPIGKDRAVERFRDGRGPQVLVSTEAGGEGRNFQFAHILVNYDLPWNPMRVEQRIGRVDRIGQEHPVSVFNFHVHGTIESRILDVLEHRIRLFEGSIGGLDPILGEAEADIGRALRLTAQARDDALDDLGERLGERVESARQAATQLRDFILDTRSYSAEIAQTAQQKEAPVSPAEFEQLLVHLLKSVNTWVEEGDRSSERRIQFHPPFTEDHRELVGDFEKRRVCFDPQISVDSEQVEYFGFGHPIVDAIVRRAIEEVPDGATAVRVIRPSVLPGVRPGWQFNWLLKVGGFEAKELVYPVFVDDEGTVETELGAELLKLSRRFLNEESHPPFEPTSLDEAYATAQAVISGARDELMEGLKTKALARYEIEHERIEQLYDNRTKAAQDRIASSEETLHRLRDSDDRQQRQAIPLWEANVERAEAEVELIREDRTRALQNLAETRNPQAEYKLLCAARIEVES